MALHEYVVSMVPKFVTAGMGCSLEWLLWFSPYSVSLDASLGK